MKQPPQAVAVLFLVVGVRFAIGLPLRRTFRRSSVYWAFYLARITYTITILRIIINFALLGVQNRYMGIAVALGLILWLPTVIIPLMIGVRLARKTHSLSTRILGWIITLASLCWFVFLFWSMIFDFESF